MSWSKFKKTYWEKSPVAFKKATDSAPHFASLLAIDAETIFTLLVGYCDRCREQGITDGLKFYVGGVRLETFEALEHLPVLSDRSLEGYHKRISRKFKDYGLVCDELLQVLKTDSENDYDSLCTFMSHLHRYVGLPNRFSEIGLYLGNYRRTPFGVHVDRCGVISLPIVGRKTFRLWDPAYVEKNPELKEAFSYDEFKQRSKVLVVQPGDVAYWPSAYWHIAEGDGSFSATWSIGIWVDRTVEDVTISALAPLLEKSLKKSLGRRRMKTAMADRDRLPDELALAASSLAKLSKKEITEALTKWWLKHRESNGFK